MQEAYRPLCSKSLGGTYLGRGRGTYLGQEGYLLWPGVPTLARGVPTFARGVSTLAGMGYPPPPQCGQTPVKTVPSRRTTYTGGNQQQIK